MSISKPSIIESKNELQNQSDFYDLSIHSSSGQRLSKSSQNKVDKENNKFDSNSK